MTTHQRPRNKAPHQTHDSFHEKFLQAQARIYERHGFMIDEEQYRFLSQQITDGQAQFITQQTPQKSVWKVNFEAGELIAVYHRSSSLIGTVLEPHMLERLLQGQAGQPPDGND